VHIKRDGEARGIEWFLVIPDQEGEHRTDLFLPISSGLQAEDFVKDGTILASAPGNRIQIFEGIDKNKIFGFARV
jgi:hypothetical protein